ncbi:uncharacterized protein BX663DRAFT_435125 [Cokeromyces recurvatus]|uniref:uncharacterized protein n=1 Tax=Cokeromyces recurvatus TaxID=90255 RepID=UPI00221FC1E0|nr:uncharacterized protein BX663DRAFT_435125 [Cokeromyces recurvatus]KAI7902653.1 hypothetical protein BX663DRAFT_435125 [Cokeromyces recurvatus]
MDTKIELAILKSAIPTTYVDMTRFIVKRTPLYNNYDQLRSQYQTLISSKLEENLVNFVSENNTTNFNLNDWNKRHYILEKTESIAPMVQTLLDEAHRLPVRLRESYIRQWRRVLVRRALAMIKFVQDET